MARSGQGRGHYGVNMNKLLIHIESRVDSLHRQVVRAKKLKQTKLALILSGQLEEIILLIEFIKRN